MPKTRELNKWLKENNYTREQMQAFWDELIETNSTVRGLHNAGYNWDSESINLYLVSQIPTQKERDIETRKKMEKEKLDEQKRKEAAEYAKQYYHEHMEEVLLDKILAGEELTEQRLKDLVHECNEVDREVGENRRWTRTIESVIKLADMYFMVSWEQGLTENQEDSYFEQPVEVFPVKYGDNTIYVTQDVYEEKLKDAEKYNKKSAFNIEDAEILFRIVQMKNFMCPAQIICTNNCPFYTDDNSCKLKSTSMKEMIQLYKDNESRINELMDDKDKNYINSLIEGE